MTFEIEPFKEILFVFVMILPRALAIFNTVPLLSRQILPGLVRNGVVVSFCLFLYPIVAAQVPAVELTWGAMFVLFLKEIFIGFVIGYPVAAIFWGIESAGFFIDNQRGATMASSMNPLTGSQTSPIAILLAQALTVYFFVSGAFLILLGGLYQTYVLWPVFSFYPALPAAAVDTFLAHLDQVMLLAVLLAAPVILAMFLSEWGLALIGRFAPQMNVFFLALPIKSGVAFLVLVLYMSILFDYLGGLFQFVDAQMTGMDKIFR